MPVSEIDAPLSFHLLKSAIHNNYLIPAIVCKEAGIHIIRTLDPEDEHQVSLARIFQAVGLTVIDGLLRFKLIKTVDYHTKLGYGGPNLFEVWVNVSRARSIVAELFAKPSASLVQLLAPSLDPCFTLYDRTRSSLLHNWRLSTIPAAAYSTSLLLESTFSIREVERQEAKSSWLRTGVPEVRDIEVSQDLADRALLEWTIEAAERYLTTETTLQVRDQWSAVTRLVEQRVHGRLDDSGSTIADGLSDRMEVHLVAMCERLLRNSYTEPMAFTSINRETSIQQSFSVATQTVSEKEIEKKLRTNAGTQTMLSRHDNSTSLFMVALVLVISIVISCVLRLYII